MSIRISRQSRSARLSLASALFFLTVFGAIWGLAGAGFLTGVLRLSASLLIVLVTLTFLSIGVLLIRSARSLPETRTLEERARGKRIRKWFGVVFSAEAVLIVLAGVLLTRLGASHLTSPVIALIVGIHFLPLARLFRARTLYLTGALISLFALIALVALLLGTPLVGPSPNNWSLFVSIATVLILWLTLLFISRSAIQLIGQGGEALHSEA